MEIIDEYFKEKGILPIFNFKPLGNIYSLYDIETHKYYNFPTKFIGLSSKKKSIFLFDMVYIEKDSRDTVGSFDYCQFAVVEITMDELFDLATKLTDIYTIYKNRSNSIYSLVLGEDECYFEMTDMNYILDEDSMFIANRIDKKVDITNLADIIKVLAETKVVR